MSETQILNPVKMCGGCSHGNSAFLGVFFLPVTCVPTLETRVLMTDLAGELIFPPALRLQGQSSVPVESVPNTRNLDSYSKIQAL